MVHLHLILVKPRILTTLEEATFNSLTCWGITNCHRRFWKRLLRFEVFWLETESTGLTRVDLGMVQLGFIYRSIQTLLKLPLGFIRRLKILMLSSFALNFWDRNHTISIYGEKFLKSLRLCKCFKSSSKSQFWISTLSLLCTWFKSFNLPNCFSIIKVILRRS